MKTPIITLACAALASFAFLACDGTTTIHGCGLKHAAKINVLGKTCNEERCWYDESDSAYFLPHDPNRIRIFESVKEWIEEQLATESNDTMLITIVDMFIHENYMNVMSISGPTEYEYYIDGVRVSYEEYEEASKKVIEYHQEREARGKRDLPIPREGIGEMESLGLGAWIGVPMTAKEIVELTENYKEIAIEPYSEAVPAVIEPDDIENDDGNIDYDRPECCSC